MNQMNPQNPTDNLDSATAARLGKLRSMPVDLSRLDRAILAQIPRNVERQRMQISYWLQPIRAVAASLLVAGIVTVVLFFMSAGPVVASAADMAQFHNDLVSGKVDVLHVDSMAEASKTLAQQWAHSPQLPNVPQEHVMACCMRSVKNRKVACVLLDDAGIPITLTVANASDMQAPPSPNVVRNGISYHVMSAGDLNMAMTQRDGKLICLIGKLPAEHLMDLASSLQF